MLLQTAMERTRAVVHFLRESKDGRDGIWHATASSRGFGGQFLKESLQLTAWYLACHFPREALSVARASSAEDVFVNEAQIRWPLRDEAERSLVITRIPAEQSFKSKAYAALKEAITNLDIYRTSEPVMLDERELSERLGVSRTPIREAVAMLEGGFSSCARPNARSSR
jgi:hypothetical protein